MRYLIRRFGPRAALLPCALGHFAACLETAVAAAPQAGAASALPAGSVAQVVAGLAAVLALVGAAAWLLRRFSPLRGTASGLIRIVGGAALGQRERIVLVEVGGTWLLVGVAPGQVRTLHAMPRTESAIAPGAPAPAPATADAGFATWLRRMTEKRRHD
ncbi:MAG: flagellar biosynthetic protein FliO [Betaproteobacteria bacterium]|nr:flagellar biosynthetic protein FliO [Betaproteobacteria bacterium]